MTQSDTQSEQPFVGMAWKCHKAHRPWLFDMDAIREAASLLGIKHPIKLGISETTRLAGSHRAKPIPVTWKGVRYDFHHQITVGRLLSQEEASKTIWHELTHAMQQEREGGEFALRYKQESQRTGYERNRFEREAVDHEPLAEDLPLVKETNR